MTDLETAYRQGFDDATAAAAQREARLDVEALTGALGDVAWHGQPDELAARVAYRYRAILADSRPEERTPAIDPSLMGTAYKPVKP